MKKITLIFSLFFNLTFYAQTITTYAGTGLTIYNGDDIPATTANLNYITSVLFDSTGTNLFFSDYNQRIRKIDQSGVISTFAGDGSPGYLGDNVAANSTPIHDPHGLIFDNSGNLILCDYTNCRIRKIDSNGIITTIAGTGVCGDYGDYGPATLAHISYPDFITIDSSGNLYFSEGNSSYVRKIDTNGIITTIAGTGVAGYNGDGILATAAKLNFPSGIAVDAQGNILIAEYFGHRIRKINNLGIISTIAGTGIAGYNGDNIQATTAKVNRPMGLKLDYQGNLYIADTFNNKIRKINGSGIIYTIAGSGVAGYSGDGGPATSAMLNYPVNVDFGADGGMYISDDFNYRIRKVSNVLSNENFSMQSNSIAVYPNPTLNGDTTVFFLESVDDIQVFDLLGQSILNQKTQGLDKLEINLPFAGTYFIKASRNGKSITKKLLVM